MTEHHSWRERDDDPPPTPEPPAPPQSPEPGEGGPLEHDADIAESGGSLAGDDDEPDA